MFLFCTVVLNIASIRSEKQTKPPLHFIGSISHYLPTVTFKFGAVLQISYTSWGFLCWRHPQEISNKRTHGSRCRVTERESWQHPPLSMLAPGTSAIGWVLRSGSNEVRYTLLTADDSIGLVALHAILCYRLPLPSSLVPIRPDPRAQLSMTYFEVSLSLSARATHIQRPVMGYFNYAGIALLS